MIKVGQAKCPMRGPLTATSVWTVAGLIDGGKEDE
jgi:hypothetical protein